MRAKSQAPTVITKGPILKVLRKNKKPQMKKEIIKPVKEKTPEKLKTRPKSEIPGFSFTLNFPKIEELQVSEKIFQIMNEHSLYPKSIFSDTDCPPTPPDNSLFDVLESPSLFNTPKMQEKSDFGTQTDKKSKSLKSDGFLRRSQRLANKKLPKEKLDTKSYTVKKIKYN